MNPRAVVLAALALAACSKKPPDAAAIDAGAAPAATTVPRGSRAVSLDVVGKLEACTLGHRGVLLDMGDASMRSRHGGHLDTPEVENVEHEGATWARVRGKSVSADFVWTAEIERRPEPVDGGTVDGGAYVEARVRGAAAKSASVYLNGKVVGGWPLAKNETKVVMARGGPASVLPGANQLTIRFNGVPKASEDPAVEIDWIHVSTGEPGEPYAAPTRGDALVSATLGGISRRALSLRAPGFVRCTGWFPPGASIDAAVGVAGAGEGDAEVRLLRDRMPPVVLGSVHVAAGQAWTNVSIPVGDVGESGTLGALELASVRATKGTRILFGEPRVVIPGDKPAAVPAAPSKNVVIVVLGGTSPRSLALHGGTRPVPEMTALARDGISFEAHRATTALGSGALASMLTGLLPRAHTLEDPDARLPKGLTTVAEAARQAGIATAMFTANPMTGPVFGFERGWDTYAAQAPNDDTPATQVFDEAMKWIEAKKQGRFMLLVHARGGHPPWEITTEELKTLPPPNYTGGFDPRRAGEILGKAKKFPTRFNDADRTRAWAAYALAVDAHDAALGRLMGTLRSTGHAEDTTVIVTGDVGVNEAAPIPFVDVDALDESTLWVPLVIRAPGAKIAGRRVRLPTSSVDLAKTITTTLGLAAPTSFQGEDLIALARGEAPAGERPLVATAMGKFAARWGPYVLSGTRERATKLCDLVLEPSCVTDVRATYPLALEALHRFGYETVGAAVGGQVPRDPAFLDPATMAQLTAWGRPPDKKKKGRDDD